MAGAHYKELRDLTLQAVSVLGERRTALLAGCAVGTVQAWVRRPQAHVMSKTVARCLPRLQRWQDWLPGYMAARSEAETLQADSSVTAAELVTQIVVRLPDLAHRWTLSQIADACEVPVSHLERWRAGNVAESERAAVIRAVATLRFVHVWPESPAGESCVLMDVAGMGAPTR